MAGRGYSGFGGTRGYGGTRSYGGYRRGDRRYGWRDGMGSTRGWNGSPRTWAGMGGTRSLSLQGPVRITIESM